MGYVTPADVAISEGGTWQDHLDRDPPSTEAGTDFKTAYGTDLRAAAAGVVSAIDYSNAGAEGRRCSIDAYDGQRISYIHLAGINAYVGMPVYQGQTGFIYSGASGFGSDYGYDPHVHVTVFPEHSHSFGNTLDFMTFVQPDLPGPSTPMEDDMPAFFEPNTVVWPNGWANSYDTQVYQAMKSYARDPDNPSTQWVRDTYIRESWAALEGVQKQQVVIDQQEAGKSTNSLTGPAWLVGALLGLIGLVQVIRLVIDVVVT